MEPGYPRAFASMRPRQSLTEVRNRSTTIVGAVLAGGESRRMGRDKAMLNWDGRTLLVRAVRVLESVFDEVIVVAPRDRGYEERGVEIVPDIRPGLGPLGGLHTALVHGGGKPVFILACDMPYVSSDMVHWIVGPPIRNPMSRLAGDRASTIQTRVVHDGHQLQPLCGLYSELCLPEIERALDANRLSAQSLLEELEIEILVLDSRQSWYRPDLLLNINELGSFAALTTRQGEKA